MSLIEQTSEERRADVERQEELREAARASGRVPTSKDARALDWLDRAIGQTAAMLADDPGNAGLSARLDHFREERARLSN